MTDDWLAVREIFLRRNLLVHADGIVNRHYLKSLENAGARPLDLPKAGTQITVTPEYVLSSLQRIGALGVLLNAATWMTTVKATAEKAIAWIYGRCNWLLDLDFPLLVMIATNTVLTTDRGRMEARQLEGFRILNWTARAQLNGALAIREEVERWDTSALDMSLAHAKDVLAEDDDRAIPKIAALIQSGNLTATDVRQRSLYRALLRRRPETLIRPAVDPPQVQLPG